MIRVSPWEEPALMRDVELLEPEHAEAPAREMERRRAAHPADAEHDHIVCRPDAPS